MGSSGIARQGVVGLEVIALIKWWSLVRVGHPGFWVLTGRVRLGVLVVIRRTSATFPLLFF